MKKSNTILFANTVRPSEYSPLSCFPVFEDSDREDQEDHTRLNPPGISGGTSFGKIVKFHPFHESSLPDCGRSRGKPSVFSTSAGNAFITGSCAFRKRPGLLDENSIRNNPELIAVLRLTEFSDGRGTITRISPRRPLGLMNMCDHWEHYMSIHVSTIFHIY